MLGRKGGREGGRKGGWKIFEEMKIFTAFAIELMPRSEIIIATLCMCPRGQCLQKFNLRVVLLIHCNGASTNILTAKISVGRTVGLNLNVPLPVLRYSVVKATT